MKYVFEVINDHEANDSYGIIIMSDGQVRKYALTSMKNNSFSKVANSSLLFNLTDEEMVCLNKFAGQIALIPLKIFETNHSTRLVRYYFRKETSDSISGSHHIGSLGSLVEFNPSSIGLIVKLTEIVNMTEINGYLLLKNMEEKYMNYYSPRPSEQLKKSFESDNNTLCAKTYNSCQII